MSTAPTQAEQPTATLEHGDSYTESPFTCLELLDHRVLSDGSFTAGHAELRIGSSVIELNADGSMVEVDQDSKRTVIDEFRAAELLEVKW
jgi:hypothetical protein